MAPVQSKLRRSRIEWSPLIRGACCPMSDATVSPVLNPHSPLTQSAVAARNTVIYGPNGLRAGWRILIFILVGAGIGLAMTLVSGIILGVVLVMTGHARDAWLNPESMRASALAPSPSFVLIGEAFIF